MIKQIKERPFSTQMKSVPLAVDLDGTLLKTDLLFELALVFVRHNPFAIFLMLKWLLRGKAHLKQELARRVKINVEDLPYNHSFLEFLKEQHALGRRLILATASDEAVAKKLADYLGIFSDVMASRAGLNLKGDIKRKALVEKFGANGFDYAGNEPVDLKIWAHANSAIVIGSESLVKQVTKVALVSRIFSPAKGKFKALIKGIRVHQWTKNLLIFVPLILAHRITDLSLLINSVYAFAAFCLISSGLYILKDILDVTIDRRHPRKKERPFASGEISLSTGLFLIPIFIAGSIIVSLLQPIGFLYTIGAYFLISAAYSFYFKGVVLVDIILLSILYTLRIIGGGAATGIPISEWLLFFRSLSS